MTSAYGGIRWETGMSRMFHMSIRKQDRRTLWEKAIPVHREFSILLRAEKSTHHCCYGIMMLMALCHGIRD